MDNPVIEKSRTYKYPNGDVVSIRNVVSASRWYENDGSNYDIVNDKQGRIHWVAEGWRYVVIDPVEEEV